MKIKNKESTLSSLFLLPLLNLEKIDLKKYNFINLYLGEEQYVDNKLYLLFEGESAYEYADYLKYTHHLYVDSYFLDKKTMIVFNVPREFEKDYKYFIEGKYSKFSNSFKDLFPKTSNVYDNLGVFLNKEHTIYYHIFNRSEWLKETWMEKLKINEIPEDLELWDKPNIEKEVYKSNVKIEDK